ncbi:MAG TPA: hypothetical protein VIL28_00410 [Steroidobacteraceae bacterium]
MRRTITLTLMLVLAACGRQSPTVPVAPAASEGEPENPAFVGKVWLSTTPGHALGTLLIFMPDRTLVMGSCVEPYRLMKWGIAGERIRWLEDTIPIEADVEMPRPNQLVLRLAGRDRAQTYITASVPYTCPDLPR